MEKASRPRRPSLYVIITLFLPGTTANYVIMLSQTGTFWLIHPILLLRITYWALVFFFFSFFRCGTGGDHPPKRFSMSGNDPTEGLALMVENFKKTVKTIQNCLMHPKSGKIFSFNNRRFGAINSCCGVCASPPHRVKFCSSSLEKKTPILSTTEDACIPCTYPMNWKRWKGVVAFTLLSNWAESAALPNI
jgi:hypothetical protein